MIIGSNGIVGESPVRFTSWNVRGLNGPVKRARIFSHLKRLGTEIAFLQETHLRTQDQILLRKNWVGQVFHSSFSSRARGTAILIHKKILFTASDIISDPQGRFIIVSGRLFHSPVVLVCIYAPNWDDAEFFKKIMSLLPDLNSQRLIFGGDMNCVMQTSLDRSNPRPIPTSKMAQALSSLMTHIGCVDPWRFLNPNKKEFSCFSHVHQSYSRIDYFFIDKCLLHSVKSVQYSAIVESDHAPVILDINITLNYSSRPAWRLNTALLSDENFCKFISNAIEVFLLTNQTDSVSPSLLWETLKAVLRGQIISFSASRNKEKRQTQERLIDSILKTDKQYSKSPTPELYKEKLNLKTQYELLSTEKTEYNLLRSRTFFYEHGEKAGRLLAHQLKSRSASRLIPTIRKSNQELTVHPLEINSTFKEFYSTLYTSESPPDTMFMEKFLENLNIPTISQDQCEDLEEPLEKKEIEDSIRAMQSGKTPGPDGFPVEFYKKFSKQLTPLLLNLFNHSFEKSALPQTLTEALITVLLKPGKEPTDCGSYRPISLLNVDVKILSKVLAARINTVITDIVSTDQTGFVKGRHSFINIRRLLNVVHSPSSGGAPEAVVSLDAEKAFDRLEFSYLFYVLTKFGFGPKFVSWVRLLYSSPKAAVVTNKVCSQYFPLSRGTRQGCPLSPLLFVLAIEPLSIKLRSLPSIQGIRRMDADYKISLYADDLLIYLTDPSVCTPVILNTLGDFSKFSGYKINYSKSVCFPINDKHHTIREADLPFSVSESGFKYLGINITPTFSGLYEGNFTPLLGKLKSDLQRWSTIYLSLAGKINCIKMNVLPRFLYLFQSIPIFLPKSFFRSLDGLILSFVWGGKISRIRKIFLERPKQDGGLALPNFMFYYWAANLQKILYWFQSPNIDWCRAEAQFCKKSSLSALLTSRLPFSPSRFCSSPVVTSTLRIWMQFRQTFHLTELSMLSPICDNPLFPASKLDATFKQWEGLGLKTCKDFFINGVFLSFTELMNKLQIPRTSFFRYLQVRHFIQSHSPSFPQLPTPSHVEDILLIPLIFGGQISKIYNLIMAVNKVSMDGIKTKWEEELDTEIPDAAWDRALCWVNGTTSCARLNIIQFKVLHRLHYSKAKIAKIYPNTTDVCDRCNQGRADLSHMFWSCPRLQSFWTSVFDILNEAFGLDLQPTFITAIFGVTGSGDYLIPNRKEEIVAFATLIAKRRLLMEWKSTTPPKASTWLSDMMMFLKIEKIKFTLRGSTKKFFKTWDPLLSYFDELTTLPSS